ncbi:MAG: hypothetical protein FJ194_00975 [Gammaproteobacteria bacterium]|nr:hypothetical protein [Gammaproteobacteria bacterium]
MSIQSITDIEFGMELGPYLPDTALPNSAAVADAVGWGNAARFTNHERSRKEGLPGALVPGILGMGFLCALIHREIPAARIQKVDCVFRAPLIADQPCAVTAIVTDIDTTAGTAELDLLIRNETNETRVVGTATIRMPK